MPFGKFIPAKNEIITNIRGEQVPLNTPSGYVGLFWGRVFHANGRRIKMAEDYFYELAKKNNEDSEFTYWELIDAEIGKHCQKYLKSDDKYHYQYGFGGDESDGIIDFWLPEQVQEMPPLRFKIRGKTYILRWEYSGGDD